MKKAGFLKKIKVNQFNSVYIILLLLVVASFVYKPVFYRAANIFNMLRQASALGVMTSGLLFVIIAGGVDLSVAATMQMAIVLFTYGNNLFGVAGLIGGILLSLVLGIVMGIVNGVIVTRYHVQPFLTTLFTGSILTGVRFIITGIKPAGVIPDAIRVIGKDGIGPVPNAVTVFILVIIACYFILNKTVFGRKLVSVGTNRRAALFSGINVQTTTIMSYCICGLLAVLSAIILAGYIGYADQWIGDGYEFSALAAAVIGGNYLGGGRGSIMGVFGGVLVTTLVLNVVLLFGLDITFQHIAKGAILVAATLSGSLISQKQS